MRKKILTVLLAGMMAMSTLAACGDAEETTDVKTTAESSADATAAEEDESSDMCADETFETLQDNYATMVDCYNEVKDLYESDEIAADEDIENLMNEAADVINEMGEISQDSITEKDAEDLNGAMVDILEGLSAAVDAMDTTADVETADASGDVCSDDTFATIQDNYATLVNVYNVVYDAYMSDEIEQDDDIESALLQTADVMEEMGDISQDTITEADAESLNDSMVTLLQVLDAVVDAM